MRVTVFDYGAGNLHSLTKALEMPGTTVVTLPDPFACLHTDVLVLPGVGAFAPAARRLSPARQAIQEARSAGLPILGICLGMQLLFERSEEGSGAGLGIIPGIVTRLRARRVPHIGWNEIRDAGEPFLASTGLTLAYYANSYVCRPARPRDVVAWSRHEDDQFPAIVRSGGTVGLQFHPEKSSGAGVRFLRAMVRALTNNVPTEVPA
jgi:imidazole glycerol-phosphate synthase subunit HisH